MSANNYVLVKKKKGKFEVSVKDADTQYTYKVNRKTFDDLEEALKYASTLSVEYGIVYDY